MYISLASDIQHYWRPESCRYSDSLPPHGFLVAIRHRLICFRGHLQAVLVRQGQVFAIRLHRNLNRKPLNLRSAKQANYCLGFPPQPGKPRSTLLRFLPRRALASDLAQCARFADFKRRKKPGTQLLAHSIRQFLRTRFRPLTVEAANAMQLL